MKQRMRLRLLLGAALAASLLTGATGAAGGSAPPPPPGFPSPKPGQTTVGVQTANKDPESLSFTVPLYLTVAATGDGAGTSRVIPPDNYVLRNTTGSMPDSSYPDIAVTGVEVRSVDGGTWSLTPGTPTNPKEIKLTIGGLTLPAVSASSATPMPADMLAATSSFYDKGSGKFLPILGGPTVAGMNLLIKGELPAGYTPSAAPAAAQFRVIYTVSLLDTSGKPIGVYYEGPTLEDAANPVPTPSPAGP